MSGLGLGGEASAACRRRDDCRLCGATDLAAVFALTPTPPANACIAREQVGEPQAEFPLELFLCRACGHLQLRDVVDPELLFGNYVYVSGTSPKFVAHFESYAADLIHRFHPAADGLAVDIGSNDGTLLRFFKQAGMTVLGIDPARDIARAATEAGIETLNGFFTANLAQSIRAERGAAALITANNVFAHADDLAGILEGVRLLLAPDGVFAFEVSYLLDVHDKVLFDTLYHEHVSYHAVAPLIGFLQRHDMELIGAERIESHGGSLRAIAQPRGGPHAVETSVAAALAAEERAGLAREETWIDFGRRIHALGRELKSVLERLKKEGKRIAGYGAPAKATTLMFHFGLGPETIDFIVDDSPLKQGLFTPGRHIPIVGSEAIYQRRPDYLLILAWNFAAPIMANHQRFSEEGGRFIVPIPKVEII